VGHKIQPLHCSLQWSIVLTSGSLPESFESSPNPQTLSLYIAFYHAVFGELSSAGTATRVQAGKPRNQGLIPNRQQNSHSNYVNVQNVTFKDTHHAVSAHQFPALKDTFCHIHHYSRTNIILHLHISSCLQRYSTMHQSTPDTHYRETPESLFQAHIENKVMYILEL
jgi:hypothetical protein